MIDFIYRPVILWQTKDCKSQALGFIGAIQQYPLHSAPTEDRLPYYLS